LIITNVAWDGWANDWMESGQYKGKIFAYTVFNMELTKSSDYYFPNAVHRTLWYHDHTNHESAMNVYKGLVGMYQIVDSKLDATLGLPSGNKYDVPLILTSHYFTPNGSLSNERKQSTSVYGDTYLVNGQIQPYLAVEPRKYRFRILNAAVSRVFNVTLMDEDTPVSMSVVASDGGYRQSPAATRNVMVGMADRWEVVVDFAAFSGKNLTLTTKNVWTDTAYAGTDQMMRFVVGKTVSDKISNAPLPAKFNYNMRFPTEPKISAERTFKLDSHMDMVWGINGVHMDDVMSRVMMRPPLGTVEKYTFKSSGMGMTTGGRTSSADPALKAAANSNPCSGGIVDTSGMGATASHHGDLSKPKPGPNAAAMGSTSNMAGHHGGGSGMVGMNMRSVIERSLKKRQMSGMGTMSMKDATWTHSMHVHLVVSNAEELSHCCS
jgi:bilirubin oxidase